MQLSDMADPCLIETNSRGEAYTCFITALKRDSSFAPAFTSLGIHYSEFVDPPDPLRASKCFQKAVELDSREGDAARRLAEGFADDQDWDLVEVVAKRTIEGEGGAEGDVTGSSADAARYKPVYAWAWKAIGIVELVILSLLEFSSVFLCCFTQNRGNYATAITDLQIALRADEEDHRTWTRLGEAYSKSGRPAAALKALTRAYELEPIDWTCLFFTAEVYRQMGLFELSIATLTTIVESRPEEVGALVVLSESCLSLGRLEFATGFQSRSEASFSQAITTSCQSLQSSNGSGRISWKVMADSLFEMSKIATFTDLPSVSPAILIVTTLLAPEAATTGVAGRTAQDIIASVAEDLCGRTLGWLAVLAYQVRMSLCTQEDEVKASAYYDHAVSLYSLISSSADKLSEPVALSIRKSTVASLGVALRGDPSNDSYWNALGSVNFDADPKIAQHSFIKAIELDAKVGVSMLQSTLTSVAEVFMGHRSRILNTGRTWACFTSTTVILSLPTTRCIRRRCSIPSIASHGLGKLLSPLQMDI